MEAFANTPIESEKTEGATRVVVFRESKPLPSYLVAMAVGPFEIIDGGTVGRNKTPLRVIATKGHRAEASYTLEVTPKVFTALENYFGIPYPYEKLDQITIPVTVAFGAMENAGLITYQSPLLLIRPQDDNVKRRRINTEVITHEIAHQWFGNMVTPAWWDDIWLNEAFASWMTERILEQQFPDWKIDVEAVEDKSAVMGGDFLTAIGQASGKNVTSAFSTFLDRTGVPLLAVSLNCSDSAKPVVSVTQERFLPLGSKGSRNEYWQTPACFEYESNGKIVRECNVIADPKDTIALKNAVGGCPAWLNANDGGTGYYRVRYEGQAAEKLLANVDKLDLREKVDLLRNVAALLNAGQMPADQGLALVPKFKDSTDRQLLLAALKIATSVERSVPENLRPNYSRFMLAMFGEKARQLGLEAKPGESDDARLLRPDLVSIAARHGDKELIAGAKQLADKWLADRASVDPNMAGAVLQIAAQHGDRAYFDRLLAELRKVTDRRDRNQIVDAIGSFRNPAIASNALQLLLDPAMDIRDLAGLLFDFNGEPETEHLAWPFLVANYDKLLPRLPTLLGTHAGSQLPIAGAAFCDEKGYREVESFFSERVKTMPGADRNLAKVLEVIQLCEPSRAAQRPGVTRFLQAW
jgi:aminopeptidase N